MRQIRFTTHALERAVQHFFRGQSLDEAEKRLLAAWPQAARLRDAGRFEERWVMADPPIILVCVIELGIRVCKTVLKGGSVSGEYDLEVDTLPAPPSLKAIIKLEVSYLAPGMPVIDAQKAMEGIAFRSFVGSMNNPRISILDVKATSETEVSAIPLGRIEKKTSD